jgi:HNH endonuclease.
MQMSREVKAQLELYLSMRAWYNTALSKIKKDVKIKARGGFRACCGESIRIMLTLDHIRPKAQGETSEPQNIQVLCLGCNDAKGREPECPHMTEARKLFKLTA